MATSPTPKMTAAPPQRKQKFQLDAYTGSLFFRASKEHDKCPDCDGTVKIGERTFEIAGWLRKSEAGRDYVFIKVGSERF